MFLLGGANQDVGVLALTVIYRTVSWHVLPLFYNDEGKSFVTKRFEVDVRWIANLLSCMSKLNPVSLQFHITCLKNSWQFPYTPPKTPSHEYELYYVVSAI